MSNYTITHHLLSHIRALVFAAALAGPALAQQAPPTAAPSAANATPAAPTPPRPPGNVGAPTPPAPPVVAGDPFVKAGPAPTGSGGDPGAKALVAENYQVILETFDLSRTDFAALLEGAGDDEAIYRHTVDGLAANRVKLVQITEQTTRAGVRTVLESIHEVRYPTQFEPPSAEEDAPFPTAFETRNAGLTFEEELTMDPAGKQGTMALSIRSTKLQKFVDFPGTPGRANSATTSPLFATRGLTTNIIFVENSPRFLGTLSVAGEDTSPLETVRIAFLRVRQNPPGTVPPKPGRMPGTLRLEYAFYSLERSAARELLLANPESQKCYDALRAMVGAKQARLDHAAVEVTTPGNRTVTEEIVETRYPTEFSPPSFPGSRGQDASNDSSDEPAPGDEAAKKGTKGAPAPRVTQRVHFTTPLPPGAYPKKALVPAVGGAYETRNTGFTVEAEPSLSHEGVLVGLNVVPQFVRYLGSLEMTGIGKTYPFQPLIETRKLSTELFTYVGRQQLLGTFNFPGDTGANGSVDDGRVSLGFIRVVPVP